MLTEFQLTIIKSTVPLLETGGEALTTHFYKILLNEHPELRPLFNEAHQASGGQQRALANSVLMYAKNIDRLSALGNLPALIINKHVSLQVQPEHYPLVGKCLLRAIREVLGAEVASDEVLTAWGAAYQQLADILMNAEAQAYDMNAEQLGGWRGSRPFRVVNKVIESSEITSFTLSPVDGGSVVAHLPGQYIGLRVVINNKELRRNYSLSDITNGKNLRISVKREAQGQVSGYLHDIVQIGSILELFPPAGTFTLHQSEKPLILISGGVGITPTLAMLYAAIPTKRPVHFIHCARNRDVHAFRETVDELATQHPQLQRYYCYDQNESNADATGLLTLSLLEQWMPRERDVEVYFLGPKLFMNLVNINLRILGVPKNQIYFEFFGPTSDLE
jgi:nitric oxide dioxygenase